MTPPWETALRLKLAVLCMAATSGKPGDLTKVTHDIIDFVKAQIGEQGRTA